MDIKKGKDSTPTPANTPVFVAPVAQQGKASKSAMSKKTPQIVEVDDEGNIPGDMIDAEQFAQLLGQQHFEHLSLASLPESLRRRINGLKKLQKTQTALEAEFREERLALERKYLGLYAPLWERRANIINGAVEPTEEEAGYQSDDEEEEEGAEAPQAVNPEKGEDIKGIPKFWLTVLKMCPITAHLVTERDEEALASLQDVLLTYTDDNHGFKLEFKFAPNEFFEDASLVKTYYLENEAASGVDDLVYSKAEGCTIHWKKDKDLTVTIETKKQRQKGTNKTRIVKRTVPCESFFNFFNPPVVTDEDEEDPEIQQRVEEDFEIGEMLKMKIIPHAVDWFTGKALQYDGYDDDYEEEDYDEEDDEDHDDDDEDDDDDDEDDAPRGKGHGHSHSHHGHSHGKPKPAGAGEKPEECKQQ